MAQKIQVRRGTAAAATAANEVLSAGEFGYETDTGKLKIGNGTTAWNSLPYLDTGGGGGGVSDHGSLTGLADDDHTQYLNEARSNTLNDARYAILIHKANHAIEGVDELSLELSQVSGLGVALESKAAANRRYWDPTSRDWTPRPQLEENTPVEAWSTYDSTASEPPGAMVGDVWYRHPDATVI